jgi:hypothetical protein
MIQRTVRGFGGEIATELATRVGCRETPFDMMPIETLSGTIDLAMGALARYDGAVIINDRGLPVAPLPPGPFVNNDNGRD